VSVRDADPTRWMSLIPLEEEVPDCDPDGSPTLSPVGELLPVGVALSEPLEEPEPDCGVVAVVAGGRSAGGGRHRPTRRRSRTPSPTRSSRPWQ
jgi:hypothetical protein